jgi:hypothetical protein
MFSPQMRQSSVLGTRGNDSERSGTANNYNNNNNSNNDNNNSSSSSTSSSSVFS